MIILNKETSALGMRMFYFSPITISLCQSKSKRCYGFVHSVIDLNELRNSRDPQHLADIWDWSCQLEVLFLVWGQQSVDDYDGAHADTGQ